MCSLMRSHFFEKTAMHEIIIVTNDKERFASLAQALGGESDCAISWENAWQESRDRDSVTPPTLMVIDETVDGVSNLQIARQIVMNNPMINLALVSSLSAQDFHEASEGLGILAQLPQNPGKEDASNLLKAMKGIVSPLPTE
jgi:hypothetical protein